MLDDQTNQKDGLVSMHHREITLADGRYMIFYTFEDEEAAPDVSSAYPPAAIEKDSDV